MPAMKPTFLFDAANSRQIPPRVSFSRLGAAWRRNRFGILVPVAANEPRFDHDPITLACRGALIQDARTNLALRSDEFDDAAWTKQAATVSANSSAAPDGATTADTLRQDGTTASHGATAGLTATSGVTYTLSVYAKADAANILQLTYGNVGGTFSGVGFANFNLSTGVVSANGGTLVGFGIEALGGGFYRCWIAATATATGSTVAWLAIGNSPTYTRLATFAGDGTSGLIVWGAQLEAGAFPTSYIPTAGSQVTRAAESLIISGAAFSSCIDVRQGTFVCEVWRTAVSQSVNQYLAVMNDGSNDNRVGCGMSSGAGGVFMVRNTSAAGALITPTTTTPIAGRNRVAWRYAPDNVAVCLNGGAVAALSSHVIAATVNRLEIGHQLNAQHLDNVMSFLHYYPAALPNADMQALTTF